LTCLAGFSAGFVVVSILALIGHILDYFGILNDFNYLFVIAIVYTLVFAISIRLIAKLAED